MNNLELVKSKLEKPVRIAIFKDKLGMYIGQCLDFEIRETSKSLRGVVQSVTQEIAKQADLAVENSFLGLRYLDSENDIEQIWINQTEPFEDTFGSNTWTLTKNGPGNNNKTIEITIQRDVRMVLSDGEFVL